MGGLFVQRHGRAVTGITACRDGEMALTRTLCPQIPASVVFFALATRGRSISDLVTADPKPGLVIDITADGKWLCSNKLAS